MLFNHIAECILPPFVIIAYSDAYGTTQRETTEVMRTEIEEIREKRFLTVVRTVFRTLAANIGQ